MRKVQKKKIKKEKIAINIVLSTLALVWVYPVFYAGVSSFKSKQEYNLGEFWDWPEGNYIIENFRKVDQGIELVQGMKNSFIYSALGAVFAVSIAVLAAYAISHLKIKHRMFWFLFIYSGTIFPFQTYLIPVYKGYTKLGLYNTKAGMVLFYSAICIPFSLFVMRNFFIGISKELCDSAKVDGAGDFLILIKIFLPMAKAPLTIVLLTTFSWCWNDLLFGLTFTKSPETRPIMSALSMLGKGDVPTLMLACIIVSIPTVLLFTLLQKDFEAGYVYQSK